MSKKRFLDALTRKNTGGSAAPRSAFGSEAQARREASRSKTSSPPSGQPVFGTGTSIACKELMDLVGAHFPLAHVDAGAMADLAIAGHTVLGLDVVMPLFSVCHECSALGCNVNWGAIDAMPESGKPIFRTPDDIRIPADFLSRPGAQVPLKAIAMLKKRLGDSAAVCGKIFGPWTLAYHLFGVENFLITTIDSPDQTRRILERLMPVAEQFGQAQLDAGADCLLAADHATRDLCSPTAYRDFLIPVHRHLVEHFAVPLAMHICGNTSDRIGYIDQTGIACFHWDTKTGSPSEVRKLAGERLALMGGISNYRLLQGQPEEIRAMAVEAAGAGIDIVGPECAIPLLTPLANLKAIAGV